MTLKSRYFLTWRHDVRKLSSDELLPPHTHLFQCFPRLDYKKICYNKKISRYIKVGRGKCKSIHDVNIIFFFFFSWHISHSLTLSLPLERINTWARRIFPYYKHTQKNCMLNFSFIEKISLREIKKFLCLSNFPKIIFYELVYN